MSSEPLVAIWMLAYNQENYIVSAIEGVLNQQTSFTYKLFIGEDVSTDKTRAICIDYSERYPEKIHLLLNEKNDLKVNARKTYDACFASGAKYIALCEGDDYWTDPLKLQKQVDVMEANLKHSLCFHNVEIHYINKEKEELYFQDTSEVKEEITPIEKRLFFIMPTCSIIFRTSMLNQLPEWFYETTLGDRILFALLAMTGTFKYIDEVMGVHHKHSHGISVSVEKLNRLLQHVTFYKMINQHLENGYDNIIKFQLVKVYGDLAIAYKEKGQKRHASANLAKSFLHIRTIQSLKIFIKDYLMYFM